MRAKFGRMTQSRAVSVSLVGLSQKPAVSHKLTTHTFARIRQSIFGSTNYRFIKIYSISNDGTGNGQAESGIGSGSRLRSWHTVVALPRNDIIYDVARLAQPCQLAKAAKPQPKATLAMTRTPLPSATDALKAGTYSIICDLTSLRHKNLLQEHRHSSPSSEYIKTLRSTPSSLLPPSTIIQTQVLKSFYIIQTTLIYTHPLPPSNNQPTKLSKWSAALPALLPAAPA